MPVGRDIQLCLVGMPLAVPISNAHCDSPFAVLGEDAHYQYLLTMPMMLREGGSAVWAALGTQGLRALQPAQPHRKSLQSAWGAKLAPGDSINALTFALPGRACDN